MILILMYVNILFPIVMYAYVDDTSENENDKF